MEEREMLLGWVVESKGKRLIPHKDYEIKHDGEEFYLVKKKTQYPKNYKECCDILGVEPNNWSVGYKSHLITAFRNLLICRDAYWMITGVGMGLDKSWEPDWESFDLKYVINTMENEICKFTECTVNCILAFPTEEMRDTFYENFKDLIEQCKELL